MQIDPRALLDINNRGRFRFFAEEHSFNMTNFLETNDDTDDDLLINEDEVHEFELLVRNILMELCDGNFPFESIQKLLCDMKTRYIFCYLVNQDNVLVEKLNESLPFVNIKEKSYIFKIFQHLMKNFEERTKYLIDKNLLIHICKVIIDDNIPNEYKIAPIKCIHYYASRGKESAAKIFDNIHLEYKGITRKTTPIDCMIKLILWQNPQNDREFRIIQECNGSSLEDDGPAMKLRLLVLKFLNAILSFDNFPSGKGEEIVDHIINCTFTYSQSITILDCAIYGCTLAAINDKTEKNFYNSMINLNLITNFINILDSEKKKPSIYANILICFKVLVEKRLLDSQKLFKLNIIDHLIPHILNDSESIVCENAIQTFSTFCYFDPDDYIDVIIKSDISDILFMHLQQSNFNLKVASLYFWCWLLNALTISQTQNLIVKFPQILEACCILMLSEVNDEVFQLIFDTAILIVKAYNAGGKRKELLSIVNDSDIYSMIDSILESDSSSFLQHNLAFQLKEQIIGDNS